MAALFELNCINGMTLRNRLFRSATWEGRRKSDGIAFSRPLIGEPALPQRWQQGDTAKAK